MNLEDVEFLITNAKSARDLYGSDDIAAEKLHIKMLAATHPDRNPGNIKAEALFKEAQRLWSLRKEPLSPPIISSKHKYQIHRIVAVGDIADMHYANDENDNETILKISRIAGGDILLKNEADKLSKISKFGASTSYLQYLPTLVETFPAKGKFQKHINVFRYEDGYHNLEKVHSQHASLDGRHIAWIFKRIMTVLGFIHKTGVVHGAIVPPHVMLYPGMANQKDNKAHALMLVGWGHSVNVNEVIKTISAKYKSWYPPEVLAKRPVSFSTDIYLAAKCAVYLAGGDITTGDSPKLPKPMNRFLKSLMIEGQSMRPSNAWDLLDEFSELLGKLYGAPKFHDLVIT